MSSIDISEKAGVRYLHFGSEWVQGAMRIRHPYSLELAYTREMMSSLLFHDGETWPRSILLIGLGAGSLTKFVHRNLPRSRSVVVEIDRKVHAAASQFFSFPAEDERLQVVYADAAEYIVSTGRSFDLILVDGYDQNARAGALDSLPFYQACWSRLAARGLMCVNLFGRSRGFEASFDRISRAFDGRAIAFPSCDSGNVVAFGAKGESIELALPVLRERAAGLNDRTGLDLRATIARLEQAGTLNRGMLQL